MSKKGNSKINLWTMLSRIENLEEKVGLLEREMEKVSDSFVEPDREYCSVCNREVVMRTTEGMPHCEECRVVDKTIDLAHPWHQE